MEPLEELLDRVRNAAGPDRELDAHIWGLVDSRPLTDDGSGDVIYKRDPVDTIAFDVAPPYTSSIDACLALIDEIMPAEWPHFGIRSRMIHGGRGWWNYIEITVPSREFQGRSRHTSLALLEALLRAQIHLAANIREPVGNGCDQ